MIWKLYGILGFGISEFLDTEDVDPTGGFVLQSKRIQAILVLLESWVVSVRIHLAACTEQQSYNINCVCSKLKYKFTQSWRRS